ncbi:MAG: zf-HC2 domain-containing protein [Fimbriimonadaceae bacterium]|nr:zf-HC2 domain-containing protein [Fimbriimonadaceae bacterium]
MDANAWTCKEAFARLEGYLDRELSPDELAQVRKHLELCEVCAKVFAFEAALLATIKTRIRGLNAPPGLRDRVRNALRQTN